MVSIKTCKNCNANIPEDKLSIDYSVCPQCGYYMRVHAYQRINMLADADSFKEWNENEKLSNAIYKDEYWKLINNEQKKCHLKEAIITGEIKIDNKRLAIGIMDAGFMMASMGQVVGEKVTKLFEKATKHKLPVILFCCSGGARLQEGIFSLMQMEKTAAAVKIHSSAGLLYISVLTDPTMGGVTSSFAMLADVILAEKGARVGFAGIRVIEQNTGEKLPDGFQTAEFQKEHGFVDAVITREETKKILSYFLDVHKQKHIVNIRSKKNKKINNIRICESNENSWKKVQLARTSERPTSNDYIDKLFIDFRELHGDRVIGDDHALVAGIAKFHGRPITVIGQQKGKTSIEEAIYYNWGMVSPKGYRKALRLMKQAEKFNRPIICFIDTIGAACGKEAEEQGQGCIIASLLQEMSTIRVPILSIIISEGTSGGALALGIGNEVWMLENAIYSVLTPEGYASILWKDNSKAEQAANEMKLKASDLLESGIIDKVISESEPVTKTSIGPMCLELEYEIDKFLNKYNKKNGRNIVQERYKRFRKF